MLAHFRPGNFLGHLLDAVRVVQPLGNVENRDRAHVQAVMRHGVEHHQLRAGDLAGLSAMIRPGAVVAPVSGLRGPVGPHRPQALNVLHALVDIFPAGVKHAAVVKERGGILGLGARAEDVNVAAVGTAAGNHRRHRPRRALRVVVGPRGTEQKAAVGQIDRIEVVVQAPRDLAETRAIDVDLVQMVGPLVIQLHGEHHPPGVERQVRAEEGGRLFFAGGQLP